MWLDLSFNLDHSGVDKVNPRNPTYWCAGGKEIGDSPQSLSGDDRRQRRFCIDLGFRGKRIAVNWGFVCRIRVRIDGTRSA